MSDVGNPARDLAATGTSGPWKWNDFVGTTKAARQTLGEHSILHGDAREIALLRGFADERHPDAEKIRRAVNALPAIADLLDATRGHDGDDFCAACPQPVHIDDCPIAAARDRVAAALTGDAS